MSCIAACFILLGVAIVALVRSHTAKNKTLINHARRLLFLHNSMRRDAALGSPYDRASHGRHLAWKSRRRGARRGQPPTPSRGGVAGIEHRHDADDRHVHLANGTALACTHSCSEKGAEIWRVLLQTRHAKTRLLATRSRRIGSLHRCPRVVVALVALVSA